MKGNLPAVVSLTMSTRWGFDSRWGFGSRARLRGDELAALRSALSASNKHSAASASAAIATYGAGSSHTFATRCPSITSSGVPWPAAAFMRLARTVKDVQRGLPSFRASRSDGTSAIKKPHADARASALRRGMPR